MIFNLTDKEKIHLYQYFGGDQFVDWEILNSLVAEILAARWETTFWKYNKNGHQVNDEIGPIYVLVVQPEGNEYRDIIEDIQRKSKTIIQVGVTSFYPKPKTLQVLSSFCVNRTRSMNYSINHQSDDNIKLYSQVSGGKHTSDGFKIYFVCIQHHEKINDWNQLLEND
jgi:hypothetical protein